MINIKKDIKFWQTIGFVFTVILGSLLHFVYSWIENAFFAIFSSVNESTWEHMKLLFFPVFLFAVFEKSKIFNEHENFWCIKIKGTLLGLALIPILFYTLRGIFGTTPDIINILIFFTAAAVIFIYETKQFKNNSLSCKYEKISFIFLCIIAVLFIIFTFLTPKIPLFLDPVNKTYGI